MNEVLTYLWPIICATLLVWSIAGWLWIETGAFGTSRRSWAARNVCVTILGGPLYWTFTLVFLWANRHRND